MDSKLKVKVLMMLRRGNTVTETSETLGLVRNDISSLAKLNGIIPGQSRDKLRVRALNLLKKGREAKKVAKIVSVTMKTLLLWNKEAPGRMKGDREESRP